MKFIVSLLFVSLILSFVSLNVAQGQSIQMYRGVRDIDGSLEHDGVIRTYRVRLPSGFDGDTPLPVVLVLHGGGGHGANAESMTGFTRVADKENFVVVYPNGSGFLRTRFLTWNSGNCCGYALARNIDDVGFISKLIDRLISDFKVDKSRVFVTGMSNGGMMAHKLGCQIADKIAAIAPVAGALNVPDCKPSEPVAVVIFHGTEDKHVLYGGGRPIQRVDKHDRVDAPARYGFTFWAARNDCQQPVSRNESGKIVKEQFSVCGEGRDVILYTLVGGGHVWPGEAGNFWKGNTSAQTFSATEVIWDFFRSHGK